MKNCFEPLFFLFGVDVDICDVSDFLASFAGNYLVNEGKW